MKDVVTFETAKALKEAGFPQPTPEAGQWWYNPDFGPFLVGKLWMVDRRLRNIFYPDTGKVVNKEIRLFPDCVFAPTATDILREIDKVQYLDLWVNRFVLSQGLSHISDSEKMAKSWFALLDPEDAIASGRWINTNRK